MEIASQAKLFKAGLFGASVTVWSSYEGGHGPTQLMLTENDPVVIRLNDLDIDDQIQFAGGYILGYTEGTGGDLDKVRIWLQQHD